MTDYEQYRASYFADPEPQPRFQYAGLHGVALYFHDYDQAVTWYTRVFGPPAYAEDEDTRGWKLGDIWLTLFPSVAGNPVNNEVHLLLKTPEEAERVHAAFIEAGGRGEDPSDQLMYEPLRFCPAEDPFGTRWLILARL